MQDAVASSRLAINITKEVSVSGNAVTCYLRDETPVRAPRCSAFGTPNGVRVSWRLLPLAGADAFQLATRLLPFAATTRNPQNAPTWNGAEAITAAVGRGSGAGPGPSSGGVHVRSRGGSQGHVEEDSAALPKKHAGVRVETCRCLVIWFAFLLAAGEHSVARCVVGRSSEECCC